MSNPLLNRKKFLDILFIMIVDVLNKKWGNFCSITPFVLVFGFEYQHAVDVEKADLGVEIRETVLLFFDDFFSCDILVGDLKFGRVSISCCIDGSELHILQLWVVDEMGENVSHQPSSPVIRDILDTFGVIDRLEHRVEVDLFGTMKVGKIGKRDAAHIVSPIVLTSYNLGNTVKE